MDLGLTEHERYFFDVNGYVVRHGVLDESTLARLDDAFAHRQLTPPSEDLWSQRSEGMLEWDEVFLELLDHPAVVDVVAELCGDTFRLDHVYGIHMRPGTSGLTMHGGGAPWDPSQYYEWREGQMYNGLVGVMWGLSESRPGDGGFCCIPGSHKANVDLPVDVAVYAAHRDWIHEVPLPPGSMLVFTEALCHGTLPWQGRVERRTLVYKYAPGHLAWAPGPGWDTDVFGRNGGLGTVTTELAARLEGRRRHMLAPPTVLRPSVVERPDDETDDD